MVTHSITIPNWIDFILTIPVLLWRRLRYSYTFRRIPLTQGEFALVDADDYYRLTGYKWYARRSARTCYATYSKGKGCTRINLHMHRLVMQFKLNAKLNTKNSKLIILFADLIVDHINGNGLDNRKANLRLATAAQNNYNRRYTRTLTSGYKGVDYRPSKKAYRARITANKHKIFLGHFKSEIHAARAYDAAAKKYHGEFAYPNFPQEN